MAISSVKGEYQMIGASQMHSVVSKYFTLTGTDISKRKHGPHALRHSLASNLLMNNTPMHVIKDVLGHTNLNTTRVYLNIDFNTLLNFALEVPYENKSEIFNINFCVMLYYIWIRMSKYFSYRFIGSTIIYHRTGKR